MRNTFCKKLSFFLLFSLLLTSILLMNYCSETPQQQEPLTCQQVKSIKLGMTPNQVESLLGPPAGQDVKTGVTHWFYDTEQGSWVIKIREGKVVDSQNLLGGC